MTDVKTFARTLKRCRKALKLEPSELASMSGLSRQCISLFELGKREPSLSSLKKLAKALGVTIDFLANDGQPYKTNDR